MTAQDNGRSVRQSSASTCCGDRAAPLATEAARLAKQMPQDPATDEGYTPTVAAWFDEYRALSDAVGEMAGWDVELLRSAAGPPLELGEHHLWQRLLIHAAIVAEHRDRPVVDRRVFRRRSRRTFGPAPLAPAPSASVRCAALGAPLPSFHPVTGCPSRFAPLRKGAKT